MNSILLTVDSQTSILHELSGRCVVARSYTPYGVSLAKSSACLGYDGEMYNPIADGYHLGQGYRLYSPRLMRFVSPDSLSPFQRGGLNAYAAFGNHPLGWVDPDGHGPKMQRTMQYYKRESKVSINSVQAAKARQTVQKKHALDKIPLLKDSQPEEYQQYLDQFNLMDDVSASVFQVIADRKQVMDMKGAHKFIFTRESELITGNESFVEFAHPMLNYFSSSNSGVISAGYMYWKNGTLNVSDYSGHYYLSAAGRATAQPVITYLSALGLKANLVRSQGVMPN